MAFRTNKMPPMPTSYPTMFDRGAFREVFKRPTVINYGFHIDSSVQDPSNAVTYLADAEGLTPAYMDYANDKFEWGSWKDAFFMPRPCMLKSDGTVDYYLDENDYSKKADGTPSDVADDSYDGNAMIEWGRDNQRIWYKIEPDENDNTSASIFIANQPLDANYKAWSFYNYEGNMVDHFYTPCYNGSLDANGKLRSISGMTYDKLCQSKNVTQEVAAAEKNNLTGRKNWYTEQFCDYVLIDFMLILISKSLNVQKCFGNGRISQTSAASSMLGTGTMDDKGMFWGSNGNKYGVKVFGMENFWANQWRRYAGHIMIDYQQVYKMTRSTADGTSVSDYNQNGNGYLQGGIGPSANGYFSKVQFDRNGWFVNSVTGGEDSKFWCDYWYQSSGTRFAVRGGVCTSGSHCGRCVGLDAAASYARWDVGCAVSYK